jgi:hypothetical protein
LQISESRQPAKTHSFLGLIPKKSKAPPRGGAIQGDQGLLELAPLIGPGLAELLGVWLAEELVSPLVAPVPLFPAPMLPLLIELPIPDVPIPVPPLPEEPVPFWPVPIVLVLLPGVLPTLLLMPVPDDWAKAVP